jgi:hypothetical protein
MELLQRVKYDVFRHQTRGRSEKENKRCKYALSEIRKWVKQVKLTERTKLQNGKERNRIKNMVEAIVCKIQFPGTRRL